MSYLSIFKLKFEKVIVIFEISTLELFKMQKLLVRNKKKSNLGPKVPYLGIFFKFQKLLSYLRSTLSN